MTDQLIRDYYACFNERRIADAGTLFAADAVLEMLPFVQKAVGRDGYAQFADAWLRACPDAQFTMERVEQRGDTMCEVGPHRYRDAHRSARRRYSRQFRA